jgi:hypothetical protein
LSYRGIQIILTDKPAQRVAKQFQEHLQPECIPVLKQRGTRREAVLEIALPPEVLY